MTGTDEKPETIGELHDRLPPGIRAHGTGRRWGILFWACPIPGHSDRRGPNDAPVVTVEWDGDVAHCTAPGCGRSSDNEQGCNCEEYDCDGSCCGGQCSCAAATASACPAATTTPRGSPMTSPEPTPDLRTLAAEALNRVTEEAWGEAPDGAGRAILARYVDAVLAAVLPAHRAMVLREAADAIADNVRNPDWSKQDRGGFYSIAPKMAYVAGHDKAADIVRSLAATTPPARQDSPGTTGEAAAVPEEGAEVDGRPRQLAEAHARTILEMGADLERYGQHSIQLNRVGYRLAQALGRVPDGADSVVGNVDEMLTALLADRDCGHDLEAFQRQAEELARLRERLDVAQTAYLAQAEDLAQARRDRDRLREDWEYRGHQLDDAATVGRALIDERDRLAAELAEMRPLVVAARRLLDQVAETEAVQNGHPDLAERAADLAQRIVDEIGHPVTDEPALGPSYREQLAALTAERNWLADTLRRYGLVIEAAKAWRIAARASEVFRLEASLETGTTMADLSTAVDALDASPGDAQTGPQDDEPAGTEQGDADG